MLTQFCKEFCNIQYLLGVQTADGHGSYEGDEADEDPDPEDTDLHPAHLVRRPAHQGEVILEPQVEHFALVLNGRYGRLGENMPRNSALLLHSLGKSIS